MPRKKKKTAKSTLPTPKPLTEIEALSLLGTYLRQAGETIHVEIVGVGEHHDGYERQLANSSLPPLATLLGERLGRINELYGFVDAAQKRRFADWRAKADARQKAENDAKAKKTARAADKAPKKAVKKAAVKPAVRPKPPAAAKAATPKPARQSAKTAAAKPAPVDTTPVVAKAAA